MSRSTQSKVVDVVQPGLFIMRDFEHQTERSDSTMGIGISLAISHRLQFGLSI